MDESLTACKFNKSSLHYLALRLSLFAKASAKPARRLHLLGGPCRQGSNYRAPTLSLSVPEAILKSANSAVKTLSLHGRQVGRPMTPEALGRPESLDAQR